MSQRGGGGGCERTQRTPPLPPAYGPGKDLKNNGKKKFVENVVRKKFVVEIDEKYVDQKKPKWQRT